jgi:hypothetical protein
MKTIRFVLNDRFTKLDEYPPTFMRYYADLIAFSLFLHVHLKYHCSPIEYKRILDQV